MELSDNQHSVSVEGVRYSNDGTVTLNLSDKRKLKLAPEIWTDLGHPFNKPLTETQLQLLEQESCYTLIRNKMLSFLAMREHSASELRRKLKQRFSKSGSVDCSSLIERSLLEMQAKGLQSDERFARQFVESKLTKKPQGPFKILGELLDRGISREEANLMLNELGDQELWLKKTIECLEKIHKKGKDHTPAALSQKLYQQGFSWETIEKALEEFRDMKKIPDTVEFNRTC